MSTNKTQNYQLHSWEPDDDFLRTEFNENFAAIDGAIHNILVTGAYTGDGTTNRIIDLGFTPRAMLLFSSSGATVSGYTYGGLAMPGNSCNAVAIVEGGFRVTYQGDTKSNQKSSKFYYMALR